MNMERAEVKQIAVYLKQHEEGLDEWNCRGLFTLDRAPEHTSSDHQKPDGFIDRTQNRTTISIKASKP